MCETPSVVIYNTSGPHSMRETPSAVIYDTYGSLTQTCETATVINYHLV